MTKMNEYLAPHPITLEVTTALEEMFRNLYMYMCMSMEFLVLLWAGQLRRKRMQFP